MPTNGTEPVVSVVVAESGGVTVQFVAPGAQPGSSVSPGRYGEVGGSACAVSGARANDRASALAKSAKNPVMKILAASFGVRGSFM